MRIEDDSQVHFVSQRKGKYILDKQKIAKKVLSLLKDGEIIFLDISTSNIEVAKIFIGGEFTKGKDGFVGVNAERNAVTTYTPEDA